MNKVLLLLLLLTSCAAVEHKSDKDICIDAVVDKVGLLNMTFNSTAAAYQALNDIIQACEKNDNDIEKALEALNYVE